MSPSSGAITAGILAVVLGCTACTISLEAARRTRNWLYLLCAAGAFAFVCGVVGQRTFPNEDDVARKGQAAASSQTPGPWDAGVTVPLIDIKANPVALGGFLLGVGGLSLVLFFEPAAPPDPSRVPTGRRVADDDMV